MTQVLQYTLQAIRPRHWIKSGFCMAALLFSGLASKVEAWFAVIPVVVAFSLLSSAGYLINDLANIEEDRQHPRKKFRVIAAGRLSRSYAAGLAAILILSSLLLTWAFYGFGGVLWCLIAYFISTMIYTLFARSVMAFDVLILSLGFVFRVCSGAYAIGVIPSVWLISLTYLGALLLAFGKRCGELSVIDEFGIRAGETRSSLRLYQRVMLNRVIWVVTGVILAMYCVFCAVVKGGGMFFVTVIPVATALVTYVRETSRSKRVEVPEVLILQNPVLLSSFFIWLAMVASLLYIIK